MSRTGITTRGALPRVRITSGNVALVGAQEPRERIAESLDKQSFAEFDTVEDIVDMAGRRRFAAILLWTEGAASAPAKAVEPLVRRFPQTPVVLVCEGIQSWAVRSALAAGAAGIVLADDLDAALLSTLQAVQAGQTCVPRDHWRQIAPPALSSREKQILRLVVIGYTNNQIAMQLFLAESTVKSHLSSAFGKLGVRSRNEAVGMILDPERGLGMGILSLSSEPAQAMSPATQ